MAKALKTAAIIIGAVALVVATAGVAAPGFTAAALASVGITATAATVATALSLAATALSIGAALLTPKPRLLGGDPTKWKADPFAGLPYPVGRTLNSGNIVRRVTHGSNNKYETFVTVLSCAGPIQSIDTFFANKTTVAFDGGGNAIGDYRNQIYQRTQLGRTPEPAALLSPIGGVPGMDATSKLSGMAASVLTLAYDSKATIPFTAEPQPAWIGHWVKCYDPRLDSTYPGGNGPCRALDETTYVWSENPFVHAITWCLGRWANGKRVIGLGAPINTMDMATLVDGANLADANRWKVGGTVYSRPDTPWTVLKAFLQAAAAIPIMVGGTISCMAEAPRVSLATITNDALAGECSLQATQSRRARINGVVPRYRSEAHDWQVVAADLVQVADYVAVDGGERTKDIEYVLVQDAEQAAQLARYEIENAREYGPITVQLKPAWMNYRVGDCITLALRELAPQKMLILGREVDPATGIVSFTMRSETDGKHAFALGQTGVAPPTPSVAPYAVPATAPAAGSWAVAATSITTDVAQIPALVVTGACEAPNADGVIFEYRRHGDSGWSGGVLAMPNVTRQDIASVTPDTVYDVAVSYRSKGFIGDRLILGPVTTGDLIAPGTRGLPGLKGDDGRTSYVHYAYANSPDGTVDFDVNQPNGRAYEGSYSDFTATDSVNPGDYVWREYKGPPFGMAARGTAVVAGNSVIKTGATADWDSDAYSTIGFFNGCTLSFVGRGGDTVMAGLNTDPTTDASYGSLDYAWYLRGDGYAGIYESGSPVPGIAIGPGYGIGRFSIDYDGRYVRYTYNGDGNAYRTVEVGPGKLFYFDSSLNGPAGARINEIAFTARGAAGDPGIAIGLTNQTHTVPADFAGNVTSYAGATGQFTLNGAPLPAAFTLSSASNPQALQVNYNGASYTVVGGLDAAEDAAVLTIRATGSGAYAGLIFDQVFTLAKSRGGANGSPAALISLAASSQTARYDKDDAIVAGQTIALVAARQNAGSGTAFFLYGADGTLRYGPATAASFASDNPTYFSSPNADTLVLSQNGIRDIILAYGGSAGRISVTAAIINTSIADTVSIIKVKDGVSGDPGSPGADAYSMTLATDTVHVACDYLGNAKSGELPKYIPAQLFRGATNVTAGMAVHVSGSSGNVGADTAGSTTRFYELTGDGYLLLTGSYGGVDVGTRKLSIVRDIDNAPPSGVTGVSDVLVANITSTSYDGSGVSSKSMVISTSSTGNLRATIFSSFRSRPNDQFNTSVTIAAKVQYRPVGGSTWSDFGAETQASASYFANDGPDPGNMFIDQTVTGLSAGTNYEVRVNARVVSQQNTPGTSFDSGTQTVSQT